MKKLSTTLFVFFMGISLMFGLTASANPAIVSYGSSYSNTLTAGQGYAYILPNAKTTGTSVKILHPQPMHFNCTTTGATIIRQSTWGQPL